MTLGARRRIIPLAFSDLEIWPEPDRLMLSDKKLNTFNIRRKAVEMYANGESFSEIKISTGIGEDEVRRLVKRCVAPSGNGQIFGFHALLPSFRINNYFRSTSVIHTKGGGKGGCAGALNQLFEKFPEVREMVHESYFDTKGKNSLPEANTPITVIHQNFKQKLKELNFNEYDWPFNTENVGYQSLWSYLKNLRLENSQQAALSRSGVDAARRGTVGNGAKPLLQCLRPLTLTKRKGA